MEAHALLDSFVTFNAMHCLIAVPVVMQGLGLQCSAFGVLVTCLQVKGLQHNNLLPDIRLCMLLSDQASIHVHKNTVCTQRAVLLERFLLNCASKAKYCNKASIQQTFLCSRQMSSQPNLACSK